MASNSGNGKSDRLRAEVGSGDVVCFGFLTHCLLLTVHELPERNDGARVLNSVETVGDDAAIAASILTQWNVPARLITSPVGDDYRGANVRDQLHSRGVDIRHEVKSGWPTPFELAILDADGGRTYYQRRDPDALAELKPPAPHDLSGAGLLYVDWYDGPSVVSAIETAAAQRVPVFLNLESQYGHEAWGREILEQVSICQVSMDVPDATGEPLDIARALMQQGVEAVLVTMGADGCVLAHGTDAFWVKPPAVEIVDCYGAGAACSAGVIYGLREGWPLEDIARFAAAYSGLKCTVSGIANLPISTIQKTASSLEARQLTI